MVGRDWSYTSCKVQVVNSSYSVNSFLHLTAKLDDSYSYVRVCYCAPCGCDWTLFNFLTFAMLLDGIYISIILSLVSRVFLRSVFLRGMGPHCLLKRCGG